MNILRIVARVLIGLLFTFSGYVKVIDPVGSQIKFGEYFEAFYMDALAPASLIFGILLAVAELVIGLCLLFNIKVKLISWAALAFMAFFTILTFILAVFNPVTDCGCFGDAVKLSNWETFYKNLIILPFTVFIFFQRNNYRSYFSRKTEWGFLGFLIIYISGIAVYSYRHLPLIDFMAYKVGSNIAEGRIIPEGALQDEYDNTFIYEKDGKKQKFKINNLPDSTWTFVDTEIKLLKEGYIPPTKDFTISDNNGDFITDSILDLQGYMVFITSPDIDKLDRRNVDKINELYDFSKTNNICFVLLSASTEDKNENFKNATNSSYPTYFTDATVLKSMVRSNPGIMLLHNATILKKWHNNDIPSETEFGKILKENTDSIISDYKVKEKRTTLILALIPFLLLGTLYFCKKR